MSRARSRKSAAIRASTVLASLATLVLGAPGASAMSLTNSIRINPPMNHVNPLGGGLGGHLDRALGPGGGNALPNSFAECYRRAYLRLEKLDSSMGYEFISATARHLCGA
jgi:hypothetical protein